MFEILLDIQLPAGGTLVHVGIDMPALHLNHMLVRRSPAQPLHFVRDDFPLAADTLLAFDVHGLKRLLCTPLVGRVLLLFDDLLVLRTQLLIVGTVARRICKDHGVAFDVSVEIRAIDQWRGLGTGPPAQPARIIAGTVVTQPGFLVALHARVTVPF